jgi:two-component system nitrate/nitrite response regulator NarL
MFISLTIVLTDDHLLLLDGLTSVLGIAGHHVSAAPPNLGALQAQTSARQPDVCVLDSQVGGEDAIAIIPTLTERSPRTRVIVLTADYAPQTLTRALEAGAAGYVHKTRGIGVLLDALQRVAGGEIVIESSFSRPVRSAPTSVDSRVVQLASYLTPRERQCLRMLASGLDTTAMAGSLGVSRTTVRTHVQAVLIKLGVHSRLEAVSLATQHGLVRRLDEVAG